MIRLAAAFLLLAAPALADCAAEQTFVQSAMAVNGFAVTGTGTLSDAEPCRLEGMVIDLNNVVLDVSVVEWRLDGVASGALGDEVTLAVMVDDLRFNPSVPDRWVAYMLAEQNRRNTIDIDLDLVWRTKDQVLEVKELSIDLPRQNGVEMSSSITDLPAAESSPQMASPWVGSASSTIRWVTTDDSHDNRSRWFHGLDPVRLRELWAEGSRRILIGFTVQRGQLPGAPERTYGD